MARASVIAAIGGVKNTSTRHTADAAQTVRVGQPAGPSPTVRRDEMVANDPARARSLTTAADDAYAQAGPNYAHLRHELAARRPTSR